MHGKTSKSRIEFIFLLQTYKTEMDDTRIQVETKVLGLIVSQ